MKNKPSQRDLAEFTAADQQRSFTLDLSRAESIDQDARTVDVAFSSEEPYLRWFGYEILDHSKKSVRLGRLTDGGAVLVNHDADDHVGVIESVKIDGDRVGRATLRFGKSARAQEIFTDVIDGIRKFISVGYRVHSMVLQEEKSDGEPVYLVDSWEPHEISLVAVPADATVGVGKSRQPITNEEQPMTTENTTAAPAAQSPAPAPAVRVEKVDTAAIAKKAQQEELARIREITDLGSTWSGKGVDTQGITQEAINSGHSAEQYRQSLLGKIGEAGGSKPGGIPEIGLDSKDAQRYSVLRAMAAMAMPENQALRKAAAFELEVSAAAEQASGKKSMGIMIPPDALQRGLNVGTPTTGGHTVATEMGDMIEMLRNRSVITQVGATVLGGLQGNVAFPRQTGAATGYWVAEGGAPTESQQTFDQVALTPRTYGAFTEYTRQMMLQSSIDVENFVRNDLTAIMALGIDLAALYGSGASNQPTGVANQAGINAPPAFAAANPTFAEVVAMESAVAVDNADIGALAYVARPDMRGHFKSAEKFSGTGQTIWEQGNTVNGYNCGVSSQVTAGDLFFGNWAELLIGMWSGIDLMINPYALDTSGGVRICALQSMDIAVRHPVSFAHNNNI